MTPVYGAATVLGVVLLLGWIGAVGAARAVPAWAERDPERRFGASGRIAVAVVLGFGIGGLSAGFAGWPSALALVAALGGSLLLAVGAVVIGPDRASPR